MWRATDDLYLLYHRPSGETHVLAPDMFAILTAIDGRPLDPAAVLAELAATHDIETEGDAPNVGGSPVIPVKALKLIEDNNLAIDRRTVVVVDEASMVGTPELKTLLSAAVAGLVPEPMRARAYGVFPAVYGISWFAGSALMGWFYDFSLGALVALSVAASLLALVPLSLAIRAAKA